MCQSRGRWPLASDKTMSANLKYPGDGTVTAWCDGCGRVRAMTPGDGEVKFRPLKEDESATVFCGHCEEFLGEVVAG